MFDIRAIRADPHGFDHGLARRGLEPQGEAILALDAQRRHALGAAQEARELRRALARARAPGRAATARPSDDTGARLRDDIKAHEVMAEKAREQCVALLSGLPNLPHDETPDGADETANVEVRRWGNLRPREGARAHFDTPAASGGRMDFETAAELSGARFAVLRGPLARLERALANFMLDIHTREFGYTEISIPFLVREETVYATGQLPKFADDLYQTGDGLWLIPTAEVSLTNLVRGRTLSARDLPMRVTAYTPCFRREAGAAGRDTRGLMRQHQFTKVELVTITRAADSRAELERMTRCAETILERLALPFRVVKLCAGDLGFAARLTYDLEVWMPGQQAFREISSCSLCDDFQARRMNARWRAREGDPPQFVHTLNGSGLAVGRTLAALLETHSTDPGVVVLPEPLRPYMDGHDRILPP